jgi:uncharacterized protein YndB with AHSA1/START domain
MSTKKFDLQAWLASTDRDVRRDDKRVRAVTIRRHFDAPIDRVWSAWVEGWKTKIADGEPKPGATVTLDLGQPKRTTCKILACEPPSRLAATWTYGEPGETKPDEVEVRLTTERGGTLLALEHRSESGAPWAGGVGAGWEAGIMMFEAMFRGEDPTPIFETHAQLDAFWTELVARES